MSGIPDPTEDVLFTSCCGAIVDIAYSVEYARVDRGVHHVRSKGDGGDGRGAYHYNLRIEI